MKRIAQKAAVGVSSGQTLLVALVVLSGIVPLKAQETLQFKAFMVSPNIEYTGQGIFTLTDHLLTCDVRVPYGYFYSEIHGPGPDKTAPLIFDLDLRVCIAPGGQVTNDGCYFRGSFELSENQISQLADYQWYAWAFPFEAPTFALSGQIVPEPTACQLLLMALSIFSSYLGIKRRVTNCR